MPERIVLEPDLPAWQRAAAAVEWVTPPARIWSAGQRHGRWFDGGMIDVTASLVDRHARERPDRVALRWEGEPGDTRLMTYGELAREVAGLHRALRGLGLRSGDVVALHLGAVPEFVVALLACARADAVVAAIPSVLPTDALTARLASLSPRILFTQDGAWRRGTVLPLKARADEALEAVPSVESTIVVRRTGMDVGWYEGDRWYHELRVAARRPRRSDGPSVGVPADHPFLLSPLANRGGVPVSVTLAGAGVLVAAHMLHTLAIGHGEVTWCAGDISWLGTQVHGLIGPLTAGDTVVLYEGMLDVPTPARGWDILRAHGVTAYLTTPSVLRRMLQWSAQLSDRSAPGSLRRVISYGEAAGPDLRGWAQECLLPEGGTVADGWGQVELGGIVAVDRPHRPDQLPDLGLAVLDETGAGVGAGKRGELVLRRPWASTMLTASGAAAVVDELHWGRIPGVYATGDLVQSTADGDLVFLGRTDEVVSFSGVLVSLREVRDALLEHPFVALADVVERTDRSGNRYLAAAVMLSAQGVMPQEEKIAAELGRSVRDLIGGLGRPRLFILLDRVGDELRGDERRRAVASLPVPDSASVVRVRWEEVLAQASTD